MVDSDFKHNRVQDPTKKLDSKMEKTVRNYVRDWFDKAVQKKHRREKEKAARQPAAGTSTTTPAGSPPSAQKKAADDAAEEDLVLSENEVEDEDMKPPATSAEASLSPSSLKRRREENAGIDSTQDEDTLSKKARTEDLAPPPPPPPPPPPQSDQQAFNGATLETGLTPNEDVTGSFHAEPIEAVTNGRLATDHSMDLDLSAETREPMPRGGGALNGVHLEADNGHSPQQVATPPTTGSPDLYNDSDSRERKKREFGGLNPERMKALGLMDGAVE